MIDAELEAEAEDLPHIHSVRKALHWAGHIWEYLTRRRLRLAMPTGDPNRGRWPEHPTWGCSEGVLQRHLHDVTSYAFLHEHDISQRPL